MLSQRLSDHWLLEHFLAATVGEWGTGRKSLTSLDTQDSTVPWKIAQSEQKEAYIAVCSPPCECYGCRKWHLVAFCLLFAIFNPDARSDVPLSQKHSGPWWSLQMPSMLNAAPPWMQNSTWWATVQKCRGSYSSSLVVFALPSSTSVSQSLRSILSQPNGGVHQSLCWISIHLYGWFPSWSPRQQWGRVSFFPSFVFSIICLLCRLVWKESSQSVIERRVKWSTAESLLGSFAWWGELGHRCQFLQKQADALHTRDAFLSISPSNQCNLCLVIRCTRTPVGEKHNRTNTTEGG